MAKIQTEEGEEFDVYDGEPDEAVRDFDGFQDDLDEEDL